VNTNQTLIHSIMYMHQPLNRSIALNYCWP
jgi:hypothetical protein